MCILNDQLVHDDIYPERFGKLQGMVKDPVRGSIWTYTNKAVFKHTVFREARCAKSYMYRFITSCVHNRTIELQCTGGR